MNEIRDTSVASGGDGTPPAVVSQEDGVSLVTLRGEIDAATDGTLDAAGSEVQRAANGVVVDLSAVTFLDSVGVSFLVRLASQARERDQAVVLRGTPHSVREVLALVGAAELFDAID